MSTLSQVRRALTLAGVPYQQPDRKTLIATCPICKAPEMKGIVDYGKMAFRCVNKCDETAVMVALMAERDTSKFDYDTHKVRWTDEKTPKLILPDTPTHDDIAAQLAWITSVLNLDRQHPAISVEHLGSRGQDGHVAIRRAKAPTLMFEPAAAIYSARRLVPMLGCQLIATDAEPYGFKDDHCKRIGHVINLARGICEAPDAEQEAAAIVGTFTMRAEPLEGYTTYEGTEQRFDALQALRPKTDEQWQRPRYLVDKNTGEIVVRVSDLRDAARDWIGGALSHGWLDARMDGLGWVRTTVHGFAQAGAKGKFGAHLRCDFYRGHLPAPPPENAPETTDKPSANAPPGHMDT